MNLQEKCSSILLSYELQELFRFAQWKRGVQQLQRQLDVAQLCAGQLDWGMGQRLCEGRTRFIRSLSSVLPCKKPSMWYKCSLQVITASGISVNDWPFLGAEWNTFSIMAPCQASWPGAFFWKSMFICTLSSFQTDVPRGSYPPANNNDAINADY